MNIDKLTKEQKRAYIAGLFDQGYTNKEIVQKTGIAAPTIIKYKKEYDEDQEAQDIADIIQYEESEQIRHTVDTEEVIENLEISEVAKDNLMQTLEDATEEVKGLMILNVTLQSAAIQIANKAAGLTNRYDVGSKDLERIAKTVCMLQEAFFNPNKTQVNILNQNMQNNDSDFSNFLRD